MPWYQVALISVYLLILLALAVYGFHRTCLVWLFYRTKKDKPEPQRIYDDAELPHVTVQCPLFNEMYVAERLIEAVAKLDYPRDRLEIQVLDDSTDETQGICRKVVEKLTGEGVDIVYIHRDDRTGYKAGALENGLEVAKGELVMVFDADFVPKPDMLRHMVHFFSDEKVGMVQARWGHINRDYSRLTQVQSIMLDGHFVIEHTARHRSGRFFNFNGTAGMWRAEAIRDAGGWQHDTLTEDMDLSYRAQLNGWEFVYLPDIVTPAELPVEMNSFKSQQFRWAKGSIQVALKLLPRILNSDVPPRIKWEAFFHLTNNFAYPLLLLLSLLLVPNLIVRTQHGWREVLLVDLPLFFGTTVSLISFYIVSQREVGMPTGLGGLIRRLPLMLGVGIGLCVNQTRAVIEALLGKQTEFVRTPKHGVDGNKKAGGASSSWLKGYRGVKTLIPYFELLMAAYFTLAIVIAIRGGHYVAMPFLLLFFIGFAYVGALSVFQRR
ncbi:MAG: glycosyltransferase family 2 protein [Myxococcales bacterium]|nr:glycosyltransferase family 2 protein [Myxococcales bacterium]